MRNFDVTVCSDRNHRHRSVATTYRDVRVTFSGPRIIVHRGADEPIDEYHTSFVQMLVMVPHQG